ncbi:TetR/AcrR family transcriptional regulator [Saccharothrix violaceirubra]|uniref:AcrR family transcriptional regulator n=1 Tax=Saccharothrix violaceirubra TaxID=413306 RepID=A0A7W7WVL8_9PSEU|nr:TetR/AcrR family transcriptional regulator [Saccharothrix violaceirubra]MBB4965221.1 AcrR family transcriptional regulator [Saccharothrix violaceirubra]
MPPTGRADARRNRELLLEAAHSLFTEVGVTDAAMNDVARRAGVGPGTLWRHFPNKDALLAEVIGADLDRLADLADATSGDRLRDWVGALVAHIARYRGVAEALARAVVDGPLAGRCHGLERAAAGLVDRARSAGVVRDDLTWVEVVDLAKAVAWVGESTPAAARYVDLVFEGLVTRVR